MSVASGWFDKEAAIIHITFTDTWTQSERQIAEEKIAQLSSEVSGRFDIIVNMLNSSPILPVRTLRDWVAVAQWRDVAFPNWGLSVFVIISPIINAYFEEGYALSSTIEEHCRIVKTFEEAVQMIMAHRAKHRKMVVNNHIADDAGIS